MRGWPSAGRKLRRRSASTLPTSPAQLLDVQHAPQLQPQHRLLTRRLKATVRRWTSRGIAGGSSAEQVGHGADRHEGVDLLFRDRCPRLLVSGHHLLQHLHTPWQQLRQSPRRTSLCNELCEIKQVSGTRHHWRPAPETCARAELSASEQQDAMLDSYPQHSHGEPLSHGDHRAWP